MSDKYCPECDTELFYYATIIGDEEMNYGSYVCTNKECENHNKEVYNTGDFE